MTTMTKEQAAVWRENPYTWVVLAISALLLGIIFYDGLSFMVTAWELDEYSHSYLLPLIALFFIWQKKDDLVAQPLSGSWIGLPVILFGIAGYVFGELSSIYTIIQYSFLLTLLGVMLVFVGMRGFRIIWAAFVILIFIIPLPQFLLKMLSSELQLISSELGVAVIRLFGISVFLEGNVIDLGNMKLQVVEACSGLRYLFPLMALGFIAAYIYKAALWKRVIVFFSTIPITVLMNSVRIGLIGVTVEYWGEEAAEGFLHDFEGWAVFMVCTALLIIEMWLLLKIGKRRVLFQEAFNLELPVAGRNTEVKSRKLPVQTVPALVILGIATIISMQLPEREEIQPARKDFALFPLTIGPWQGKEDRLEKLYVDTLKFEDYILADYRNPDHGSVNFYVAYYGSQRKGQSAHSPRTCIPGGGWQIKEITQKVIDSAQVNDQPLNVNRTLIQHGDHRQLVYYWFQQRGRVITNEYLVKWYLFWDSLTRNRTDGALVRLTANIPNGITVEDTDHLLERFVREITPMLHEYVPN